MADQFYAKAGERIETPGGRYLGTIAQNLTGQEPRWLSSMFSDLQIDTSKASERLPLTSWLVSRMRQRRANG